MIKESAARIAASADASPSKSPEAEGDKAALVKELADVKKRFLAVAKKKQADFAKRVRRTLFPLLASSAPMNSRVSLYITPEDVWHALCCTPAPVDIVIETVLLLCEYVPPRAFGD